MVASRNPSATEPLILINGRDEGVFSALDRGLHYGDGHFTTLRVAGGVPQQLDRHLHRLQRDASRLGFPEPDIALLAGEIGRLAARRTQGVLKVIITRGSGGRGYRTPAPPTPTRLLCLYPAPESAGDPASHGVIARMCRTRLGVNPSLAGIKHLNRLEQVLARQEWDDPVIAEGIMQDVDGHVVEGVMSNLFWVRRGRLYTPLLDRCGVMGVQRTRVLELARAHGLAVDEVRAPGTVLDEAEEAFLTNSVIGLWPVRRLEGRDLSVGPVSRDIQAWLRG